MNAIATALVKQFEGHDIAILTYRGEFAVSVRDIGRATGYGPDGKGFQVAVSSDWADEFIAGSDLHKVEGAELRDFKSSVDEVTLDKLGWKFLPTLLLLTESGLWKALLLSRKQEGRRLRDWLSKQVLPEIARTGQYVRPEVIPTPVDSFGRLEEWERIRKNVDTAGRVLITVTSDISRIGSEQARQNEKLEILEARVCRGQPTKDERDAMVSAIHEACECRASKVEKDILEHIALAGPATSYARIGAAARINATNARERVERLQERALVDVEQRDPNMKNLRNYFVLTPLLAGHTQECQKFALESLGKMIEMTDTAVHVVPPNIPHIPQPQLALREIESSIPAGSSEREELMKTVRSICYHNGLDYHDFMSKLYIRMKFEGMDCKKTKKTSRIDYMERHNWCGIAKQMAEKMPIHEIRQAQNVGHA